MNGYNEHSCYIKASTASDEFTFSIPQVHNKWHITQVNFITKKKSIGGITSFVLDPGYLPALTGMQRNLSPECLFMKEKVPVLALRPEYARDVFRNYKNVEVQD